MKARLSKVSWPESNITHLGSLLFIGHGVCGEAGPLSILGQPAEMEVDKNLYFIGCA